MGILCFFDNKDCVSQGACLECGRFPGTDEAKAKVGAQQDPREALIKARDVSQIDPSQFVARTVLHWDEAVYGYGPTAEIALAMAEFEFRKAYDFAVRYHEFVTR